MTGRLLRTRHAGSFLARQRWRTTEGSWLGVPNARASRTLTRTRKPKPGRADTRGCGCSTGDEAGDPFLNGLLHVVVRRRGSHDRRFRWPGQRRAHERDEVRVVRGVARAHKGLEAPEVRGGACMAAVRFLRLAEQLLLEGLRRVRRADARGADLGEEAELGRPEAQQLSRLGCPRRRSATQLGCQAGGPSWPVARAMTTRATTGRKDGALAPSLGEERPNTSTQGWMMPSRAWRTRGARPRNPTAGRRVKARSPNAQYDACRWSPAARRCSASREPHAGQPTDPPAAGRRYHAAQRRQTGSSPSWPNPCCWGLASAGAHPGRGCR